MRTIEEVQKLFQYKHLPDDIQGASMRFYNLATALFEAGPVTPMLTKALNELWQAKNWAVANIIQNRDDGHAKQDT